LEAYLDEYLRATGAERERGNRRANTRLDAGKICLYNWLRNDRVD
jgi:hypothetical protein